MSRALIIVDVQNDFCEGAPCPSKAGRSSPAPSANTSTPTTDSLTTSWRPRTGTSIPGAHFSEDPDFVDSWPKHCVAGTRGAELHPDLDTEYIQAYFRKGQFTAAYSGFEGLLAPDDAVPTGDRKPGAMPVCRRSRRQRRIRRDRRRDFAAGEDAIGLDDWLQSHDVEDVVVVGIATDHCVKATALDGVQAGYSVTVLRDLTVGVAEDLDDAIAEMELGGVDIA